MLLRGRDMGVGMGRGGMRGGDELLAAKGGE